MPTINRQITLAVRPHGYPEESDFKLVESTAPEPGENECLVQVIYLSVDPYMRGRLREAPSYAPHVELGQVMVGGAVSRVVKSRHPMCG